ncbi:MAG: nickel insertion protein, partial [Terriglobales bacterium]
MRIGFLDANSGVSGDMLLAAAVAAGADLDPINRALPRLGLEGRIEAEAVSRNGVQAVRLWLCRGKEDKDLLGAAPPVAEGAHPHLPGAAGHGHTRTLEEILHRLG